MLALRVPRHKLIVYWLVSQASLLPREGSMAMSRHVAGLGLKAKGSLGIGILNMFRNHPALRWEALDDEERPLVPEVVAALESRRRPAKPIAKKPPQQVAKKVPIYDDFGEVVRWVWRDL